jgi:hypothetical protein
MELNITQGRLRLNEKQAVRKIALILALLFAGLAGAQQSYTFTNCGATGSVGPTQLQVNASYTNTNLSGLVTTTTNGIQTWTVPYTGNFRIEARGAQGGTSTSTGGLGATMAGDFALNSGEVIWILVGQRGENGLSSVSPAGGGGGSYVIRTPYTTTASILVIAGGGTGGGAYNDNSGLTTTSGGTGGGAGGTNGSGGSGGTRGAGGGGFLTDGGACTTSTTYALPGQAFVNGGLGGGRPNNTTCYSSTYFNGVICAGGFGGGSSHGGNCFLNGGAGGGYSGGGGSSNSSSGGGGSFNAGTNQSNTAGNNSGHGRVIITELCNINLTALGSGTNNAICTGNSVTLTTSAVSNYSWSTGATTSSIVVSPTTTTVYSLTATSSQSCTTSAFATITVNQGAPSLTVVNTASASGGACPGKTVALTANGATTYTWTGNNTLTNGVPFTPSVSSGYTVTGLNACGSSTASTSVSIHPSPTVTAIASSPTVCSGVTTSLIASGANTYSWSNGLPNGSGFTPAITNTYIVTGTNSATGCTATAAVPVTVVTTPILAPVATPTLICIGKSATLSASGAANYSWSPGQSTSSIVVNPTTTTTYTITKWNANCVDTKVITLTVNALPSVFAIGGPTLVCAFQTTTLNAGGANTYSWSPFGGNSSQAIVSPSVTTDFVVSASDGTCINTATVPITVNPLPVISIASTASAICLNQSASMTVSGTDTYSWTNPGSLGTATSVVVTPTTTILYHVVGTNTVTGCSSDAQQIMLVHPLPSMTVAATRTLVCVAGPSTLTVKGNTNTLAYNWSTGPTTTNTIVNPTITTVYSVTGTNTVTTCQSTSMVAVNVYQPTFATNSPTSTCLGGTITLMASGATSYTWLTTPSQPFQNILVSPQTATYYVIAATSTTVNNIKCISQDTVFVSIYSNPTITAAPSRTAICKNETVNLIGGGGSTYIWNTQQVGDTVNVKPLVQTNYTVTGTDQNGCKSTATVQVKVSSCVGIDENTGEILISVYPNPTSGNFTIQSEKNVRVALVNELGQLIREFDLNPANNRKVQVTGVANGIYFLKGTSGFNNLNHKIIITN